MKHKKSRGLPLIAAGLLLLIAAAALLVYNLRDDSRAGQSAGQALTQLRVLIPEPETPETTEPDAPEAAPTPDPEEIEIPDHILNPKMDMPVQAVDGVDYIGVLSIPALSLELPVISEWSYDRLKTAPCRYRGSAYLDDLVIAAHNYRTHFAALKDLRPGDAVTFTDVDGNVFSYAVADLETLPPDAVEDMTASGWPLTLFTCTTGGSQRIAVRCEYADG